MKNRILVMLVAFSPFLARSEEKVQPVPLSSALTTLRDEAQKSGKQDQPTNTVRQTRYKIEDVLIKVPKETFLSCRVAGESYVTHFGGKRMGSDNYGGYFYPKSKNKFVSGLGMRYITDYPLTDAGGHKSFGTILPFSFRVSFR